MEPRWGYVNRSYGSVGNYSFNESGISNGSDFVSMSLERVSTILTEANVDELIRLVPMIVYLLLIALTGIPGNGLVCYIYRSQYNVSSSRWFIFFLATVDLILCIVIVPCEIATTFQQYNFTNATWCRFSVFLNLWALLSLGLTLVIVSIDRYRKVCKPLGWQINFSKARVLCILAVIMAFIISLPVFSVYGIHEFRMMYEGNNITAMECSFRTSETEANFAFIYVSFGMVMFSCALATICVLYCFIGAEIKQHTDKAVIKRHISLTASMARKSEYIRPKTTSLFATKSIKSVNFGGILPARKSTKFDGNQTDIPKGRRKEPRESTSNETEDDASTTNMSEEDTGDFDVPKRPMTRAQKTKSKKIRRARAKKATWSMFLISLAFVLSYLPFLSLLLVRSVHNNFDETLSDGWRAVYKFFLRSYFLNCSINPFIYGISDSKFRQSCKAVLDRIREWFWTKF